MLAPLLRFRLGWDTASPVIDFDGTDPREAAQRLHWANDEVLPRARAPGAAGEAAGRPGAGAALGGGEAGGPAGGRRGEPAGGDGLRETGD